MNTTALAAVIVLSCAAGCAKQEVPKPKSEDLHPGSEIVVKIADSDYEEMLSIPGEWDGVQTDWEHLRYHNFRFVCPSASVGRILKFLYRNKDFKEPDLVGAEIIPDGLYSISFGEKKWATEKELISDAARAIEIAFSVDVSYVDTTHTVVLKKAK